MRTVRKTGVLAALVVLPCWPASTLADDEPLRRARVLMGTVCEARAFGDPATVGPALEAALDRIAELEDVLTTWRDDGGLARLNAACASAPAGTAHVVDPDLAAALADAVAWARATDGAFDPSVGALADAWGLRTGGRTPTEAEIETARALTSWRLADVDRAAATVRCARRGVAFDLGGFGKGLALDAAALVLRAHGVDAALINFGGQVLALGAPPGADGWIVDIAGPDDRDRAATSIAVRDRSVATSSGGVRPGHLLDPRTGRPVARAGSATVVHRSGAVADALATAAIVVGPDRARALMPDDARLIWLEPRAASAAVQSAGPSGTREASR